MSRKRIPIFRRDQKLERLDLRNCAVREFDGDGRSVGRCMHYVGKDFLCPRHCDVKAIQEHYIATGELTDDPRRRLDSGVK